MADKRFYLEKYLQESPVMQVATGGDSGPWICSVFFVADNAMNLYWLSFPTRRHSRDIMMDRRVAVAVAAKHDLPVIGVQGEGDVEVVEHAPTIKGVMEKYIAKYDTGHQYYDNFLTGKAKHRMYKFTPSRYALFDEVHFPDEIKEIIF